MVRLCRFGKGNLSFFTKKTDNQHHNRASKAFVQANIGVLPTSPQVSQLYSASIKRLF